MSSFALLTDLYQLTMAYGYWKLGMANRRAAFHLSFRKRPFGGAFAIAAGLQTAAEFITHFRFDASDLAYLESLKLFEGKFLEVLERFSFTCNLEAMPEGTPVFPYQPILRVEGPLLEAQILESPLLNLINFQTLIATKSARICWAARPDEVVEFGMRRAQGPNGAISAARAAFIGGCHSTSDVLAAKLFDIPVKGTHAHSWIMAFDDEEESFRAYAQVMPKNCVFLVDTYNSIEGTKKAIRVGLEMRKRGVEMVGVRLDSGDLAALSIEIRKLLDAAGFPHAKIMASNELDEVLIADLKAQGAKIDIWGVGTHLVTGKDQPALDGVYKLSAIQDAHGKWHNKLKVSEQLSKVTNPGLLQVRRYFNGDQPICDMMYDINLGPSSQAIDYLDPLRTLQIDPHWNHRDLLVPILKEGKSVYHFPTLFQARENTIKNLSEFPTAMRRFLNPPYYFTGLEKQLHDLKRRLIDESAPHR